MIEEVGGKESGKRRSKGKKRKRMSPVRFESTVT
jgi:hypothetical protein